MQEGDDGKGEGRGEALADTIFEPWPNYPDNEVDHVAAFLLACQLTINLTQHPDYPNPSGGSLVPECVIPGVTGSLGSWMTQALAIWNAGGVGYTREEMTAVATALNAFCNSNLP